jgi:hypothetical protein
MNHVVRAVIAAVILLIGVETIQAQTTTLGYGQIPSTMKSVSALHFNIAQRMGLFFREGINVEMISIEGARTHRLTGKDARQKQRCHRRSSASSQSINLFLP